jgi:hypothetical protein
MKTFEQYMLRVGIRSVDYKYTEEELWSNVDYFKESYNNNLSEYKALEWLYFHLKEKK